MRLGILTALWGRPNITHIYLDRLMRLKNKYDILPFCVGSENEFRSACDEREILYADHENKPLGAKWNFGLKPLQYSDVTHVMILGSDDFASDKFMEYAMDYAESNDKDFCGCYDLWIYGGNPRRGGFGTLWYFRYPAYLVGPGRIYSRKALDLADWTLWHPNKNSGLDGSAAKTIRLLGNKATRGHWICRDEGLFMVDIKTSGGNISSIPGASKPELEGTFGEYVTKYLPDEAEDLIKLIHEEANTGRGGRPLRSYGS